ncbi:hypothetical protein SAMN02745218_01875 [Desulfofundulus australicus DSM 11792]|uniref:2-phosphosulfolactate phosphatase n=1 Tax=Desulfofundulus australicus DSM 11792 TaxID=1121425 RepID=A0A1M5AEE7_9FIRM|nr:MULTISPECIES: hypothetical protein [Desulfofundulus]MDK2887601.1 hypothetical protein [Thermoanaerobacter sp.]SHF28670.1 hypothetical protein SAMN02745218_01875 [Desulfofundulus australicus DSM 11792]
MVPVVILTANASGAAWAGKQGLVVLVVDVIDMSTSLEAALDEGAAAVLGASPDAAVPPVPVDPLGVGRLAGEKARELNTGVVVIAEPRTGPEERRRGAVKKVLGGIAAAGARLEAVIPNLGAAVAELADFKGKVVVAATGSGGVAFDAALTAGAPAVMAGTVARTRHKKGRDPAMAAARRTVAAARSLGRGVAVVAASSNSVEDLLAARYIYDLILELF